MFVTAGKKVQNVPKLRVKLNLFLTFKDKKGTDFDQPHTRKGKKFVPRTRLRRSKQKVAAPLLKNKYHLHFRDDHFVLRNSYEYDLRR